MFIRVFQRTLLITAVLLVCTACAMAAGETDAQFRFSYLPYYDTVRFIVLSPQAGMTDWRVVLTAVGGTQTLAERSGKFPQGPAGETMPVPKLAAGVYQLTLTLTGNGAPEHIERTFTRKIFPWEHNTLGKEQVVIPPFTPLKVDRRQQMVECVLRQYRMGSSGFWEQVTSEGHPLLAAPMRLEMVSNGRTYRAAGSVVAYQKQAPYQVLGATRWKAGPLQGRTNIDYDYDGMMKVTLQLSPTKAPVDSLDLVIPMKADEAWLMHPVTDVLRSHYAGKIPDGAGKVWDSANLPREQLPGPFVPYIFLGGPERGICWFADNDRDWVTDAAKPALEITREGDTVNLIVHFVNKSSIFTRPRTIIFGLQATPAKPMPEKPYSYRRWWMQGVKSDSGVNFNLLGACYYWGANTLQFYPAYKNFSFYDTMSEARKTGKYDAKFIDQWMQQFTGAEYSDELRHTLNIHVLSGLNTMARTPKNTQDSKKFHYIFPYTNARAINWSDETETYMDEWSIYDIADPRWDTDVQQKGMRFIRDRVDQYNPLSGVWYEVDPEESYTDMALYYHKKMLESFADGIYWDNFFFKANYNPVPGPGYIGDDGILHPGVSLFAFRNLTKRCAIMQYEMGMRPISFIHMTNVNCVPILSFGAINFDWEWRDQGDYAVKDLQDRLDVDNDTSLILAASTGLQTGNISVAIDRFNPPANSGVTREWLERTVLAVCLPHEIKPQCWDCGWAIDLLEKFGYGQPDCQVYRYWEPGQPIATSGVNVKTLVLQRGKQALVIVGSFGPGGDCTLKLDLAKLRLPETVQATNDETGAAITSTASGTFVFPIKKHDVQFVLVQ